MSKNDKNAGVVNGAVGKNKYRHDHLCLRFISISLPAKLCENHWKSYFGVLSPSFAYNFFFILSLINWGVSGVVACLHTIDSHAPELENWHSTWMDISSRDWIGLGDPSFPSHLVNLHLVKENMCHLNVFGLNLDWWPYFVSVFPGYVRRTHNGNQHGTQRFLWHQFQQVHQQNCHICLSFASCCSFHLFLSLLILVVVSCWFLLSSVSRFLPVVVYVGRLCDEQGTQHIEKKCQRNLFLEVFWFQFFSHHWPGTWLVFWRFLKGIKDFQVESRKTPRFWPFFWYVFSRRSEK